MNFKMLKCALAIIVSCLVMFPAVTLADGLTDSPRLSPKLSTTDRLIVKFRSPAANGKQSAQAAPLSSDKLKAMSRKAGVPLTYLRAMSGGAHVLRLPRPMSEAETQAIVRRLQVLPEVEYVEPDRIQHHMRIPNDTQYVNQWHYKANSDEAGAVNLPAAWDVTTGSAAIVVAVVDTGTLPHEDLAGRTLPGYDFVSEDAPGIFFSANDGSARDSDPTDPGDWVTDYEYFGITSLGLFTDCNPTDSSWHGTHVAGTIGAATNNGRGVAGINWVSKILPVRVLGKCGGYISDITDGMLWAAGLPVTGVLNNPNPAKVLNLSLGDTGPCGLTYQNVINDIVAAGAVVVVAAGNENADVATSSPANCNGVIPVAATNRGGSRASYSNFGSLVKIAAPGGEKVYSNDPNGVLSTLNSGKVLAQSDDYQYYEGTSMATPHVAGIVSLMLSVNPGLSPAQVLSIIQSTARAFPAGSSCTMALCGAGIINAAAAVTQSLTAPAVMAGWWWNPAESGRGFSIEVQGNNLFMAGYLYADGGRATWLTSAGAMSSPTVFNGALQSFGNGQTLTGAYQPASLTNSNVGAVSLQFNDASHATLTWPGGTMPIERYIYGSGTPAFQPETGWWWNAAESGRGFTIEIQGNTLFMAGYMYDTSGNPIWYSTSGKMSTATLYQGTWQQYANGQTLTGTYHPPSNPGNVGAVTLQFTNATEATLTLPDGRQIPLTRYRF
jgi:subtilisin family serine protease